MANRFFVALALRWPCPHPCQGRRHHRRWLDLCLSDPFEVVGGLQRQDRHEGELSVDRLGRRSYANQGGDRRFRRVRRADEAGGAAEARHGAVSAGDRRHRARGEHRRHRAGQIKFTGPLLADIYLGKVKTWNDPAIAKINPTSSSRTPRSPWSIARTARARLSTWRTISPRSAPSGKRRSAKAPPCNGRSASAARAMRASRRSSRKRRTRSAMSSTPTCCKTS